MEVEVEVLVDNLEIDQTSLGGTVAEVEVWVVVDNLDSNQSSQRDIVL